MSKSYGDDSCDLKVFRCTLLNDLLLFGHTNLMLFLFQLLFLFLLSVQFDHISFELLSLFAHTAADSNQQYSARHPAIPTGIMELDV